jgi:DNA invertase Pin-like site-specific DNA recombinase
MKTEAIVADRPPQIRAEHLEKLAIIYVRQSTDDQVQKHPGSTADQLALAQLPRRWGWPESRIITIDHDLGRSGTSADTRAGFKEMINLIETRQASLVLVRDVSRLSRDPLDSEIFLTKAMQARVFIFANNRLFDSTSEDLAELFAVRIQNLLAWYENQSRVRVLTAAKTAKVRQGYAVTRPPIGYVQAVRGKWIKDPDPQVRDAVAGVFSAYLELRSVGKLIRYWRQNNLRFPRRRHGEVGWGAIRRPTIEHMLRDLVYTGDYIFRRFKITAATSTTPRKTENRPSDEWIVYRDHHEGYVTQEQWHQIETIRSSNRVTVRPIVGKGPALVQGLVCCGSCGRWMKVHYSGQNERLRVASYLCRPLDEDGRAVHSISCSGRLVDEAVVRHVLAILAPPELESAVAVIRETNAEQASIDKARQRQLQRAQDDVDEARRRYYAVDPAHDLVRADLEAQLQASLQRLDQAKRQLEQHSVKPRVALHPDDATELLHLASDIAGIWKAPTTTDEDRKRLLRAVLSEIVVKMVSDDAIDLELVWVGGLREKLHVLRPHGVDEVVKELRSLGMSPSAIADQLRATGITTAQGKPMSRGAMHQKLKRLGLNWKNQWLAALRQIAGLVKEGRPYKDIVTVLATADPKAGWKYQRVYKAIQLLQRGVPGIDPLPDVLPINEQRDEVMRRIIDGRSQGKRYRDIADELNAAGFHPKKAKAFSGPQVRDLLYEWEERQQRGDKA